MPTLLDSWDRYAPPGAADEMFTADGGLRSAWGFLGESLRRMGPQGLVQRADDIAHRLRQSGAVYRSAGDSQARPWSLDPVPLVLESTEWSRLERALLQRAELLNLILGDLYGGARLVKEGRLPRMFLHRNPSWLRPALGTLPAGSRKLLFYAADLARGADGHWRVLSDRTQNPSGAGYALENRMVLSQSMPSLYRDSQVHRLAPFFRTLRSTLRGHGKRGADTSIAILTPGPQNETYFEHAFLANYLGFPLVEGSELTVREGRLYTKALGGLHPVDVVLRRVDEEFCDPLELRGDSLLGTPGLLTAVRERNLSLMNPLGTGVLENRALPAFLPRLCRELLGEELLLESVPTLWMGDADHQREVTSDPDAFVLKPVFRALPGAARFVSTLDDAARGALLDEVRRDPHLWVAQRRIELSTVPAMEQGRLVPRSMNLRTFVAARDDEYMVMPGGLARVAADAGSLLVSNQAGGTSKDVWILASEPQSQESLLSGYAHHMEITRRGDDLSSRAAENLFWIGRYSARVDLTARLLREIGVRLVESRDAYSDPSLEGLLGALTRITFTAPGFLGEGAQERLRDPEPELVSLTGDGRRIGSLSYHILRLGEAGLAIRDRLPDDLARVIRGMADHVASVRGMEDLNRAAEAVVVACAACRSLAKEGLDVGHRRRAGKAWRFVDLGQLFERTQGLALFANHVLLQPGFGNESLWRAMLGMTDGLVKYRHRKPGAFAREAVLDLVVFDETNPESAGAHLGAMEEHLMELLGDQDARHSGELRILLPLRTACRTHGLAPAPGTDEGAAHLATSALLHRVWMDLAELGRHMEARWFHVQERPLPLGGS